ncbi:myelin-associated glycoprotein-like [Clarias gariepinus]|uniref:myelin-associated glycoprotein-like n=1 Tax=Clarias gariepinus TaxID=13013 RepID=UPI00234DC00F|nr:myelin-associated glycoprotein-like [Clarias gariepinus]
MDRFRTLKLFIAVSLLVGVCHCLWVSVDSVNAVRGSCVLVPCSTVAYSKVAWYKYVSRGYPTVYSNDYSEILSEFRGRTSVPGSRYSGDCSLRIDNVQYSDREVGLYVWVWDRDGYNQGFYEDHQIIKINVFSPSSPQISVGSKQVEGKPFTATCKFRHSCRSSSPQIYWHGASPISNTLSDPKESAGLWETEGTATFKVTQNTSLSCSSYLSGTSYSSSSVFINVLYAPKNVKINYTRSSTVDEGNKISLQCTSNSNPAVTAYEWLVTQNTTTTHYRENPLVLQNVRRDTSVSCIATNSVGTGQSQQLSLSVNYAPTDVKVAYTGSSSVIEGGQISLTCTSMSRPAPTHYEWLIFPNSTTFSQKGSTVVLQDVRREMSVSCIANNSMGHGESKQLLLNVHYLPSILPSSVCFTRNGILTCECQAEANPNANISWTVNGRSAFFPIFNITTQHNGSLTVSELTGPQGHNVTCTAANSVGQEFTQILVQFQGNALALVVAGAAGAAGVCIIIIIAVAVIVICKKRRHAEPSGDLTIAQPTKHERRCHDYHTDSDEDLYANTQQVQRAYKEQIRDSCIYANYDLPF